MPPKMDKNLISTIPVPRRRQRGPTHRFLSQREPGRKHRQIVSPQCDEENSRAHEDHVGRLCGLAPGSARDEDGELPAAGGDPLQPVLEQPGGGGPSESEATIPAHAGIQAIRQRGGNDLRNRASVEDQKRTTRRCKLGGSTRKLAPRRSSALSPAKSKPPWSERVSRKPKWPGECTPAVRPSTGYSIQTMPP